MAAPSVSLSDRVRERSLAEQGVPWFERVCGGAALLLAAPAIGVAAGVTWFISGQAPLVAHRRVGLHGRHLWVFKLRTMWEERRALSRSQGWIEYLDDPCVPVEKRAGDPRVSSRFASFCRRHSVDELPQLYLIMAGKMRFVGPRPLTREELDTYYGPAQAEVLSVPPGLTGLWQVKGRNRLTYAQRRRFDLFLVRRRSWRLSVFIFLRTVAQILRPTDAW